MAVGLFSSLITIEAKALVATSSLLAKENATFMAKIGEEAITTDSTEKTQAHSSKKKPFLTITESIFLLGQSLLSYYY
jgi:hypothetical protein